MRLAFLVLTSLLAASSAGCQVVTCTDEQRASLSLTVVDAETGEDVEAEITFSIDGDAPRMPEETFTYDHTEYVLAYEQDGTFEVTVSADGYQTAMKTYQIEADECHVTPQSDTIELTPAP